MGSKSFWAEITQMWCLSVQVLMFALMPLSKQLRLEVPWCKSVWVKNYTNFPIAEVSGKEMKLIGCFRYSFGDYRDAGNLVATGKVKVKPLITHKFKFEDAAKAYDYNIAYGGER
ncbi:BEM_collapsed_G0045360.mRNA.1.CDS.1 [Saccharomyces cerevisiae]|nr:BEM_collapsed_G0045360.mRNA.1.CDS.1 [Saccharomyces cerevisiae]